MTTTPDLPGRTATDVAVLAAAHAITCADRAEDRAADDRVNSSVAAILARSAATEAAAKACEVARLLPDPGNPIVGTARGASERANWVAERLEAIVADRHRPASTI